MENLIGVVLCGGNSTRMGKDKGLLKKAWKTWSQRAEEVLLELGIPVYISVNKNQLVEYKQFHAVESLIVDNVKVQGPLAGILSAHSKFPDCDVLVIASDMIFMQPAVLNHLIGMNCLSPEADVVAYESNYLQTLCALYKASFLQCLMEKLSEGRLTDYSLQHLIRSAELHRIPVKEEQESLFRNCNYERDIYEPDY